MKEIISDIIDQNLNPEMVPEALERIAADADGCRVWRNYHLIGAVIRGEVRGQGTCLMDRVRVQLEQEPVVPGARVLHNPLRPTQQGIVPPARSGGRFRQADALKAAGLFSLAASLALVSVITLVPQNQDSSPTALASRSIGQESGSSVIETSTMTATGAWSQAEFGQMLAGHGEFTGAAALNGLLAYAKFVSNEPLGE